MFPHHPTDTETHNYLTCLGGRVHGAEGCSESILLLVRHLASFLFLIAMHLFLLVRHLLLLAWHLLLVAWQHVTDVCGSEALD